MDPHSLNIATKTLIGEEFKPRVHYFLLFHQMVALLFHLKISFKSQDIQILVIYSLPFHFPDSKEQIKLK